MGNNGKFQSSFYRKAIFSGVFTNFEGLLPISYEYNLVSTLIHHGFMICSYYRALHFEILKLKQIFQSNEHPKNFADRCVKMYLDKVFKHPNICIMPKKELVVLSYFSAKGH